ncbi:uncharacterized protein BCR38DRAFT_11910 [Pseudomassariella vexata]|uniref:Thymidylate kinase n=1 Tax=Pseudomassariella vexata TaxID=1141098 RepID=A0A1Y2EKZ3_9PEZI|nr:uncharacterized protein BCR38DRAFT_11910 [Pseudomassariella vexata]ORY71525.1 hypothetical protein BCR38DRAFT_11910 [Pseudomassariella vexata]
MATVTRIPFAPIDGARLQTLTSCKNRQQHAISMRSPGKRKVSDVVDTDDFENIDPVLFSKRSKGTDSFFTSKDVVKPPTILITKSASTGNVVTTPKMVSTRPRSLLHPKSPAARLNTSIAKSTPLSAPAGRSPTRGKRTGILSLRRRTAGPYTRVDPPVFGLSASSKPSHAPFSLDAALRGTIPSYTSRSTPSQPVSSKSRSEVDNLHEPELKSSWFFDIHEDTTEQEMTNLLQHSTCVLDISSDEECESRRQIERAEGKENVPPADDISQTSRPRAVRLAVDVDDMVVEKERNPLGEMNIKDYYAEGCDEASIIIVPGDEDEEPQQPSKDELEFAHECKLGAGSSAKITLEDGKKTVGELLQKTDEPAPSAARLQPIEGTDENFDVWESGSTKDETG